jgi:rhodanese-related sulfurtransferase
MHSVDVDALATALAGPATLVDVREPREYAEAHVPGARLLPMGQVSARVGEIDPATPVFVICATGNRSRAITDLLAAQGYDARNVEGGTTAWVRSGRAVERGL